MEALTQYLTKKLLENDIIEAEESEIYSYGIRLILSSGFITICITLIGVMIRRLILAISFMLALAHLRHYAGGYHADSYKRCFWLSCSLFMVSIGIILLQEKYHLKISLVISSLVSSMYLWRNGSLNSERNPKTEEELFYRTCRTRQITIIYSLISSLVLILMDKYLDIATMVICTQIYTALSMWILQYVKEQKEYEKADFKNGC